ncbi:MAG: integrin, partial [Deltaproteobacteria bacterium]|nr:integrin [Deltaproteobacteria bacterium]
GAEDNDDATNAGAAYVFVRDVDGNWSQEAYVKAFNSDAQDRYGSSVSLSSDGNTLAVGASSEQSDAIGVDGDETNNDALLAGAVYVYARDTGTWTHEAYLKASNTDAGDQFGARTAISGDGNTLAVCASGEDSNAQNIDGDADNDDLNGAGAGYVFVRDTGTWTQQAYVKASNTGDADSFGASVGLSSDGNTLAVGSNREDSDATGIDGDQDSDGTANDDFGAVYVYVRNGTTWSPESYVKASNAGNNDRFGISLGVTGDGSKILVGAVLEDSDSSGIDGDATNDDADNAGAAYLY